MGTIYCLYKEKKIKKKLWISGLNERYPHNPHIIHKNYPDIDKEEFITIIKYG